MPNPKYIKGVAKERALVNEARDKGLIAFRSAGSHSPIDVCIINPNNLTIQFIQCKSDNHPISQTNKLLNQYKQLNNEFMVSFEVR